MAPMANRRAGRRDEPQLLAADQGFRREVRGRRVAGQADLQVEVGEQAAQHVMDAVLAARRPARARRGARSAPRLRPVPAPWRCRRRCGCRCRTAPAARRPRRRLRAARPARRSRRRPAGRRDCCRSRPATPASAARRTSSGCWMPFSTIGSDVISRSHARSAQVSVGLLKMRTNFSTAAFGSAGSQVGHEDRDR